ncbi:MAG: SGNH/GDSL hydrolase family protein [Clostridia bacterium]|nr:SGNH/GDSL hydrolase family protein [Clostridia bacterium]
MNLSGKTVIFLGSSVTYGSASGGVSFVDLLAEKYGMVAVKEAVSGTTLADIKDVSYISRMKKLDKSIKADAFICQLSTNDAARKLPLGEISHSFCKDDFDTQTVAGAIEYIIAYEKEVYSCPIAFYTQARYDSEAYRNMAQLLYNIKEKWNIHIIDLWNCDRVNNISDDDRKKFMYDPVHPTRDGYELLWLPVFEEELNKITGN